MADKIVVGTGWWCAERPHAWAIGSPKTRTQAFFETWRTQVEHCLTPARIHVTDSASPLKPDGFASLERVAWTELDANYGHANDIRTGKIATKYSGFTRSVLLGAMYALAYEASHYVYVEQDCLVFGENLLAAAMGESEADILLGQPTRNGVGLSGAAAPMLQQCLMIVRRAGLERFIGGILASELTDGQRSPEETARLMLQPIDLVKIPYGRSRPIDPGCPHFYAQHLTDAELAQVRPRLAISG